MPHHILLNLRHVFLEDICTHRFWRQELDTLCWGSGQGYYPHDCNFHSFFLLILQLLIILLLPLFLSCHSLFIKRKNKSEVAQSCPTLCDPMDTRLLCPWDFLGKSTGVGCRFLLQGTSLLSRQEYWSGLPFPSPGNFPTQGSNPGLPHCRQTLSV